MQKLPVVLFERKPYAHAGTAPPKAVDEVPILDLSSCSFEFICQRLTLLTTIRMWSGFVRWGIAMLCASCTSGNQREFPAEVNIHLSGLRNSHNPGVFVFPRLLVCLDCGHSSFMTPTFELAELCA